MEKLLIVNADEFGLTEGVNRAIVESHRSGIVTSATLMPNGWAFEDAVSLAGSNPELGVGLHINFTFGSPIAPPEKVRSIIDDNGRLLPRSCLLRRWMKGTLKLRDIEVELRAQVEKVRNTGLEPTHFDSHQNTMMIPGVFRVCLKVADEMRMPIRLPYEPPNFDGISSVLENALTWRHAKKRFTGLLCEFGRLSLRARDVKTIDRVFSLPGCFMPAYFSVADSYEELLSRVGPGVSELLTHPGLADERLEGFLGGSSARAALREEEYMALTSERLKKTVRRHRIRLVNYREFGKCPVTA